LKKLLTFWILCFWWTNSCHAAGPPDAYFNVFWKDGKAWFLSPSHKPFLSMGVNAIADESYRAVNPNYYDPVKNQFKGDKQAWVKSVFNRMGKWHFNTIGSWSDKDLLTGKIPFTYMLYIARGNPWEMVLNSVFSEDFEKRVKENARKAEKFRGDSNLIGYFLDNELPWWGEFGWKTDNQKTLLELYAAGGVEDANKEALKNFLIDRYSSNIDAFNQVWGTHLDSFQDFYKSIVLIPKTKRQQADANAWAGVVAERYFSVTTKALKEVDPHHLILGVRFAGEAPWEVVDACAKYCDVISVNQYQKSGNIDKDLLDNIYFKTHKPILLTEYSFRAVKNQSDDPNTKGADVTVPTQLDRAEYFDRFARQLLDLPYIVGLHWFQWADQSPHGRFDGEDSNYGLVDIHDREYALLTGKHAQLNLAADSLHEKASAVLPTEFKAPVEPHYRKADPNVKVPDSRRFFKIESTAKVSTWGDSAQGGKATVDLSSGDLNLDYETGVGWGCGISCPPNVAPFVAPGVADLRGYNFLQFEAFVPKGLNFQVYLNESGAADPSSTEFKGLNGADGESYSFPPFQGTGKWTTYQVDLVDLERRTSWGNQKGNNILDLQALSSVDLYLPGNQGTGKILLRDLEFKVH
jgi:hypothetical protein